MGFQICSSVKASTASLPILIHNLTDEGSPPLMNGNDVTFQGIVLSECLPTSRDGARELLFLLVRSTMFAESGSRDETFATTLVVTDVVPSIGMCGFDMMLEMRRA